MAGIFGGTKRTHTAADQLANMSVQTSGYGRCIPIAYGKVRVAANLIFYSDFTAIPHTKTTKAGKGGGGSTQSHTDYTYEAAVMLGICEGPVNIGKAWVDKEQHDGPWRLGLHSMEGGLSQAPWAYLLSRHPAKAVGYGSTAYVCHPKLDLGASGSVKNHSFEVTGFCSGANNAGDASPADMIFDMLANPIHGMGFPGGAVDSLANYREYAAAAGLLVSACYDDQRAGLEVLKNLLECTNSISIWSGGKLRVLPLGDLPIGDWRPDSTPQYALGCDDFLGSSDPVKVKRKTSADAYNSVKVKFRNRDNDNGDYSEDVAGADDLAMQDLFGIRPAPDFSADCIANPEAAQMLAHILLQRYVGIRNEYQFKLGWRYILLEPGDLVTLTEPGLGLLNTPVRIVSIQEDEGGDLEVVAEDWPNGIATAVAYPAPERGGEGPNMAVAPGNCNRPVIFEPPIGLSGGELQIWIGASGGPNWGGCDIWMSRDGDSYSPVGRINAPARHGYLAAPLQRHEGLNPDDASVMSVDLTISKGELISASQADADHWETLCYVGGELISHHTATQAAANWYDLRGLRRGLFGSANSAHGAGEEFMRLDNAVAQITFDWWQLPEGGTTIWLKFPSFNIFGRAAQGLDEAEAYPFTVSGLSLRQFAAPYGCAIAISEEEPA